MMGWEEVDKKKNALDGVRGDFGVFLREERGYSRGSLDFGQSVGIYNWTKVQTLDCVDSLSESAHSNF